MVKQHLLRVVAGPEVDALVAVPGLNADRLVAGHVHPEALGHVVQGSVRDLPAKLAFLLTEVRSPCPPEATAVLGFLYNSHCKQLKIRDDELLKEVAFTH